MCIRDSQCAVRGRVGPRGRPDARTRSRDEPQRRHSSRGVGRRERGSVPEPASARDVSRNSAGKRRKRFARQGHAGRIHALSSARRDGRRARGSRPMNGTMTTKRNTGTTITLGRLVDAVGPLVVTPLDETARTLEITGVTVDSRAVRGGELFVAVRGSAVDGHRFVRDALERGAAAVIIESGAPPVGAPFVVVEDSSKALALVAARYYGNPADALRLCGVTGTNGKTSTTHLVRAILAREGMKTGLIGTLGHGIGDTLVKDPHTTPDAVTLHAWFRRMQDEGCVGVVMEVSSHAVRQHRVWALDFEVGMLTNVTHDHLDYHSSMEDYKAAKAEFCYSLNAAGRKKPAGTLAYWCDDPNAREIGSRFSGRRIAVGTSQDADWRVSNVEVSLDGTRFTLELPDGERAAIAMKLRGAFVPANAALAALAC